MGRSWEGTRNAQKRTGPFGAHSRDSTPMPAAGTGRPQAVVHPFLSLKPVATRNVLQHGMEEVVGDPLRIFQFPVGHILGDHTSRE